jgi:cytochrome c-type biogenesis protein
MTMGAGVSYIAAFGGGIASFLSPCVLPIVPGYLSMVTGLDLASAERGNRAHLVRIVRETCLFVAGFGVVFTLLGLVSTSVGLALTHNQVLLTRISGGIVLTMALILGASLIVKAPWFFREARFHPDLSRFGPFAAPVAGAAFGFGWTPCIGPILASILGIASGDGSVSQGAGLLAVYSIGLGVPFLVVGLGFGRLTGALKWFRRHSLGVTLGSVTLLGLFGLLLILDRLTWVTAQLQHLFNSIGLGRLVKLG